MALEFDEFESVCGVTGEFWTCGADAPEQFSRADRGYWLPCTRMEGHAGDHVAAHTNGSILARWNDIAEQVA